MTTVTFALQEDYWLNFEVQEDDIEFIYNHLLEIETPQTTEEIIVALVSDRISREKSAIEKRRTSGGDLYKPKELYEVKQSLIFPAFDWQKGSVTAIRDGRNPGIGDFKIINVAFETGEEREFASGLEDHILNEPPKIQEEIPQLDINHVLSTYTDDIITAVEEDLVTNPDFVRIAGKWFPRALLLDINVGHLNIAEAVLDMSGGGPYSTSDLLEQVELDSGVNQKLLEFSLDLALQEDDRFDEVGPAGDVLWFLKRLEPPEVLSTPLYLQYDEIDYDQSLLDQQMLDLVRELDDELSPTQNEYQHLDEVEVCLIFPHIQSGTLPLTNRVSHLFPTAYEAPRIRFTIIDEETEEGFPAWVVRDNRYIFGLKDWYEKNNFNPGSIIKVKRGNVPGEVILSSDSNRSTRDWIKTVLVGSDGGVVFAMLKQLISGNIDDRMGIAIPDPEALIAVWEESQKKQPPFEEVVVSNVNELAKLNPQSHVHAIELYAAVNVVRRCPPEPILALLASRPWFTHVGDLHFRLSEQDI